MAAIIDKRVGGPIKDRLISGGSLVASKYVLTAAHRMFTDDPTDPMPLEADRLQVTNIT